MALRLRTQRVADQDCASLSRCAVLVKHHTQVSSERLPTTSAGLNKSARSGAAPSALFARRDKTPRQRLTPGMNFLGIDVGTGGTRAVVVNEQGHVVAAATREHAPFASPQTG